jgi:uncharacterized protein YydD (DUF2326 family)
MFLKNLIIEHNDIIVRNIKFHKGINLIIDETNSLNKKETGNNVGKTTILRLIDFCLAGDGKSIYQDNEFKSKTNILIEDFLKENNVLIKLILKEDLEDENSKEILIERNFLTHNKKIQKINGEKIDGDNKIFAKKLKELIFLSIAEKPTFRQIISKNIRDDKNRVEHTVRVLHPTTKQEEYEALYLFWLGIELDSNDRKQKLLLQKKIEENLQKRLKKENNLSQITQSLIIIDKTINELENKKDDFEINENFEKEFDELNRVKLDINKLSTAISKQEIRKNLILESKDELENNLVDIDIKKVEYIYNSAKSFIPKLHKTFEEVVTFHKEMIKEKTRYITNELPYLEIEISSKQKELEALLEIEKELSNKLRKITLDSNFQNITTELTILYEKKGSLEEQKRLWESTLTKSKNIDDELIEIDNGIESLDEQIQERITKFNKYFSDISYELYNERFILSSEKNDKGLELVITSISDNPGKGKKKGQIAAFDLAYIKYAEEMELEYLHFILQDQIENVHDNQISLLLQNIVSKINCQYILTVLRDKLPSDIDADKYKIISLSQDDKLFKV